MSGRLAALAAALLFLAFPSAASAAPVFYPDPVQFDDHEVGAVSAPIDVLVTNDSAGVYEIGDAVLDGDDAADFEIVSDSCSDTDLDETSACVVSIRFAPKAAGDRLALLVLENAVSGDEYGVVLEGFAYERPSLSGPAFLDFPPTRRGAHRTATATFTNVGEGPVEIRSVSIRGSSAFSASQFQCAGTTLSPGSSCTILAVGFAPAKIGPDTATLVVESDAANAPHEVSLAGEGLPAGTIRVEPTALDFGAVAGFRSQSLEAVVRNTGDNAVRLTSLPAPPTPQTAHVITQGSTCFGDALASGGACRVVVELRRRTAGALAFDLYLRESRTKDVLATLPLRAQIEGPDFVPWAGGSQLDTALVPAGKAWRRIPRAALRRRGFALTLRTNLGGRATLEVFALVPGRSSASVKRMIARGSAVGRPWEPHEVVARATRFGRRVLLLRRALRLRALLTLRPADGRRFARGLKATLPARRR